MSGSNSSAPAAVPLDSKPRAEPLSFTVHNVGAPDLADPVQGAERRTARGRLKMLLVLLVCAAPVIASYVTYFFIRPEGRTNYSALILPTRTLPVGLPLRTLDGQPVAPASLRGQWLLVSVGSGACDAACDRRLFTQRQLREMLGREKDRLDKVWLVIDDAPVLPALRQALAAAPSPVTALRAPREAVAAWLQPDAGRGLEEHLYLVDPMGEWMMRVPAEPDPSKVKRDLERVLRASASWDQPGR